MRNPAADPVATGGMPGNSMGMTLAKTIAGGMRQPSLAMAATIEDTYHEKGTTMKRGLVAALLSVIVMGGLAMGQRFPAVSESQRIEMLRSPAKRPVRMVLDTDTYNEIDDQFAVVYALISPEVERAGGLCGAVP